MLAAYFPGRQVPDLVALCACVCVRACVFCRSAAAHYSCWLHARVCVCLAGVRLHMTHAGCLHVCVAGVRLHASRTAMQVSGPGGGGGGSL